MNTASHILRPAILAFSVLLASALHAATYTVTSTSNSGNGSLRKAINDAETNPGPDIIDFDPTLSGATITVASGNELLVTGNSDVTLDASALSSPVTLNIATGQTNRLLSVDSGSTLTLKNLVLVGGKGAGASDSGTGGAIRNAGTLTMLDCYCHGNNAINNGGALHNLGTATLTNCTFADNATPFVGGGVNNANSLTATSCTFTANTANGGGGSGAEGASAGGGPGNPGQNGVAGLTVALGGTGGNGTPTGTSGGNGGFLGVDAMTGGDLAVNGNTGGGGGGAGVIVLRYQGGLPSSDAVMISPTPARRTTY